MVRSQVCPPNTHRGRKTARRHGARPPQPLHGTDRRPRPPHDRQAALARVLALWPHELADDSLAGRQIVLAKLRRALRDERRRGLAGHWAYDLARHSELLRVYREELATLGPNALGAPGR